MKRSTKPLYLFLIFGLLISAESCKKKSENQPVIVVPPIVVIDTPNEVPDLPFEAWTSKTLTLPSGYDEVLQTTTIKSIDINVNFSKRKL